MKVLVTGGAGFLGSNSCLHFAKQGWDVIALDNFTKHELIRTGLNPDKIRDYICAKLKDQSVTIIKEDIRNRNFLQEICQDVDFIIHTAAQPAMTISYESPYLDFETNVVGTVNLLECAAKYNIPLANCSTIHVYGNKINDRLIELERCYTLPEKTISEEHPVMTGEISPLHASKFSAETYIRSYIDSYKVMAANFRLTGLYGPNQFGTEDHGWVANFTFRNLLEKEIHIFGSGKQVRDALYVDDVVHAFECFYNNQFPGTYNLGGGYDFNVSLFEALDVIQSTTKIKNRVAFKPDRQGDLRYFSADYSKAQKNLNWKPMTSFEDGIKKLSHWIQTEALDLG